MLLYQQRTRSGSTQTEAPAAAQLRAWAESEGGQRIWNMADNLPSLERICHALNTTHAVVYGVLIAPGFFTIFSTFHPQSFARLADRYRAAAKTGLCVWWDGSTLCHCTHSDTFFAYLRTLPPPV